MTPDWRELVFTTIATTLHIPKENIKLEAKIEDLSNDSIQLFELIIAFEKVFTTQVPYEDLMSIETVGDIIAYIENIRS